ncbi:hypothetical protein [Jidongwangia harbinensis]|uniref:hypothetical protein n=1 Tax=Jidongwangia harbinensis TaxID=2878561 RepID=UPI001CDA535F|nr:hypothetical protein [Jidongwangia harbinensis]MCA2216613.1 hypothetical protein [Jidongwangia harbinensis]
MLLAEIAVLLSFGAATWLAQDRMLTAHPARNRRVTAVALTVSVAAAVAVLVAAVVTRP